MVFSKSVLGGFRAQGRTAVKAKQVVEDALAVQAAGAFAVVVECVPSPVAKAVTEALEIPTIGIGAGAFNSGQVSTTDRIGACRAYNTPGTGYRSSGWDGWDGRDDTDPPDWIKSRSTGGPHRSSSQDEEDSRPAADLRCRQ